MNTSLYNLLIHFLTPGILAMAIVASVGIICLYMLVQKRTNIFSESYRYVLIINIFSLCIFAKLAGDVGGNNPVASFDLWVSGKVVHLWATYLNEVVIFITSIGNPLNLSLLSLLLFGIFVMKKKWYYSILLFAGMTGGEVIKSLIKVLVHRERPINSLIEATGYSFPSGHATMSTIFFIILLLAFKNDIRNNFLKILFVVGSITASLLIGFSRIYLNVHWVSDVLAGFAFGLFWFTSLVLSLRYFNAVPNKISRTLSKIFTRTSTWFSH